MPAGFRDLRSFLSALDRAGELRRVRVEVDPELEITEIVTRVVREEGPALLFENVRGASFPLAVNLLGNARRVRIALGQEPEAVGELLVRVAHTLRTPRPGALLAARGDLGRALKMGTRATRSAPCHQVEAPADLGPFPITKCWPGDGGRFITFGMVLTADPTTGIRNLGIYRMQVFDRDKTGMHWQIQKGGGFHYHAAEARGRELPVAVVIGADPAILLASVAPLPEGMDELAFAGLLRGARTAMTPARSIPLDVPAFAEVVLEGVVPPNWRQTEGPFGDHFGHYSHAAPYPVFHVRKITHRRKAIFAASIVGRPPQEDKHMGEAVGRMFTPILRVLHPEVVDLAAYFEAGFHNLLVVAVAERYAKEGMKAALGLLGQGQLSLTKCLVLVDETVPVRDFGAVLRAVRAHFDPAEDFLLLPGVPLDTLDFTSYRMNLGSKMVLDATSRRVDPTLRRAAQAAAGVGRADAAPGVVRSGAAAVGGVGAGAAASAPGIPWASSAGVSYDARSAVDLAAVTRIDNRVLGARFLEGALLIVAVQSGIATGGTDAGTEVLARLLESGLAAPAKIVAVVSEDIVLDNPVSRLWGIFTRFDAARDVRFRESALRNAWPTHRGSLGIDATWKRGYPEPLVMPDEVVKRVDSRWSEYGIAD